MPAYITAQKIQDRGEWWIGWIREVSGVKSCQEGHESELLDHTENHTSQVLEYDSQVGRFAELKAKMRK